MKSPNPFFCGHDKSRFVEIDDPHNKFQCSACRDIIGRKRMSCTCCGFNLHPFCSTAPGSISSSHHPQHPLTLVGAPPASLRCDVCPDLIEGMYYTCQINGRQCNFDLHPICAKFIEMYPPVRVHTLDPTHSLELKYKPGGTRICDVCRKDCGGWAYRCGACSVDAHVGCLVSRAARPDTAHTATVGQPGRFCSSPPGAPPPAAAYATSSTRPAPVGQPGRKLDTAKQGFELVASVVDLIDGVSQLLS